MWQNSESAGLRLSILRRAKAVEGRMFVVEMSRRTKDSGFQTPFVFVLNETRKGIEGRG
jgi:hypothetical protein